VSSKRKRWSVYYYILPTAIFVLAITIFPMVYSVYISLHDYMLQTRTMTFVGLTNFLNVFQDPKFYQALGTTFKIAKRHQSRARHYHQSTGDTGDDRPGSSRYVVENALHTGLGADQSHSGSPLRTFS
jgi:hypothetical protein